MQGYFFAAFRILLVSFFIIHSSVFAEHAESLIHGRGLPSAGPENGTLFIHGGGNFWPELQNEFVEAAGGKEKKFVIIPTASPDQNIKDPKMIAAMKKVLTDAGVDEKDITILHTRDRNEANSSEFTKALAEASGVLIWGGRQNKLADAYLDTETEREMHKLLQRGGAILGSSAGASIQGSVLARGDSETRTKIDGDHKKGFSFMKNVAFDQHVLKRNRQFQMFDLIESNPAMLGIGIDEDTAIVVKKNQFRVTGKSKVLVYDNSMYSVDRAEEQQKLAKERGEDPSKYQPTQAPLNGKREFYCLSDGQCYDVNTWRVLAPVGVAKPK